MHYKLKREALSSITDEEVHAGTTRLLPKKRQIPEEFWDGNVYSRTASSLYFNEMQEPGEFIFLLGFQDTDARADMLRCVRAHLRSFEVEHEHKIAGAGYMISKICTITPPQAETGHEMASMTAETVKSGDYAFRTRTPPR